MVQLTGHVSLSGLPVLTTISKSKSWNLVRNPVQSVNSGIGPFSSRVLNLNHLIHKKNENLQWEKCRYVKQGSDV